MTPRRRIIPVFVPHEGCPHACVFCSQRQITGQTEPATAGSVRAALLEAERFLAPGAELAFYGGSFTAIAGAKQEELLRAAAPWRESGFLSALRVSTRPDAVEPDALERLRRYGVQTVELGAQSMDDRVLRLSGRGHTAEDTCRAATRVREAGFSLILQMMTGLPGSSAETDLATAEALIALRPDGVRLYPTVILRDTPLYRLWRAGKYREHTVEEAVSLCARLVERFAAAGIPVIRLGLNPTEALSAGEAAGGAYHPALGELVYARLYRRRAEALLKQAGAKGEVTLGVHPSRVSLMVGQRRQNLAWLKETFGLTAIRVVECEAKDGEIFLLS